MISRYLLLVQFFVTRTHAEIRQPGPLISENPYSKAVNEWKLLRNVQENQIGEIGDFIAGLFCNDCGEYLPSSLPSLSLSPSAYPSLIPTPLASSAPSPFHWQLMETLNQNDQIDTKDMIDFGHEIAMTNAGTEILMAVAGMDSIAFYEFDRNREKLFHYQDLVEGFEEVVDVAWDNLFCNVLDYGSEMKLISIFFDATNKTYSLVTDLVVDSTILGLETTTSNDGVDYMICSSTSKTAWIYSLNYTDWDAGVVDADALIVEEATLTTSDVPDSNPDFKESNFGAEVACSFPFFLVAQPFLKVSGNAQAGRVNIFEKNATGYYFKNSTIRSGGAIENDAFGSGLAANVKSSIGDINPDFAFAVGAQSPNNTGIDVLGYYIDGEETEYHDKSVNFTDLEGNMLNGEGSFGMTIDLAWGAKSMCAGVPNYESESGENAGAFAAYTHNPDSSLDLTLFIAGTEEDGSLGTSIAVTGNGNTIIVADGNGRLYNWYYDPPCDDDAC